jgi:hypothetical protein
MVYRDIVKGIYIADFEQGLFRAAVRFQLRLELAVKVSIPLGVVSIQGFYTGMSPPPYM